MQKKRKPVNGRVLVEEIKEEKRTASGLILPDTQRNRQKLVRGVTVAADEEVAVKAGEVVYFRFGVGYDVMLDDKNYILIKATDLELVESN